MQLAEEGRRFDALPMRDQPPVLDEGSHLSYAIQWFAFALIFGFGYIQFVRWQEERGARIRAEESAAAASDGAQSVLLPAPSAADSDMPPAAKP
jgi:hypothetical protein